MRLRSTMLCKHRACYEAESYLRTVSSLCACYEPTSFVLHRVTCVASDLCMYPVNDCFRSCGVGEPHA